MSDVIRSCTQCSNPSPEFINEFAEVCNDCYPQFQRDGEVMLARLARVQERLGGIDFEGSKFQQVLREGGVG